MSKIEYTCWKCGREYELRMRVTQKKRRCSFCGEEITTERIDRQEEIRQQARQEYLEKQKQLQAERDAANAARWAEERAEQVRLERIEEAQEAKRASEQLVRNRRIGLIALIGGPLFLICVCAGIIGDRIEKANTSKAKTTFQQK